MGRRFGGQGQSDIAGRRRPAFLIGLMAGLLTAVAIAGCGEGSGKSASAAATTTATTATTPTTPTTSTSTSTTTSTAAKPPASKSSKSTNPSSTTPAKTATTPKPPPAKTSNKASKTKPEQTFGKIKVSSTSFKPGGPIAATYTCDGAGTSPQLQWHGVPSGTAELFMLAIDLTGGSSDAIQWAVAGISPSADTIPAGGLPAGAVAGVNSAGKVGWGGVCGTKGQLQHIVFLFYALDHKLGLKTGFNPVTARKGLKGSLGTGLTAATYQRP